MQQATGSDVLKVKYALDDMVSIKLLLLNKYSVQILSEIIFQKRIVLSKRRYVFMALSPAFSVGIALPDKYGLMVANITIKNIASYKDGLLKTRNWAVHPDWYLQTFYMLHNKNTSFLGFIVATTAEKNRKKS